MTSDEPPSYDFVYVEADIPPGMTIREWRRQRSIERAARREQMRSARRGRALKPLTALMRAATGAFGRVTSLRRTVRRSAAGIQT